MNMYFVWCSGKTKRLIRTHCWSWLVCLETILRHSQVIRSEKMESWLKRFLQLVQTSKGIFFFFLVFVWLKKIIKMNKSRAATCQWDPRTVGTTDAYCVCSSAAAYFFPFFFKWLSTGVSTPVNGGLKWWRLWWWTNNVFKKYNNIKNKVNKGESPRISRKLHLIIGHIFSNWNSFHECLFTYKISLHALFNQTNLSIISSHSCNGSKYFFGSCIVDLGFLGFILDSNSCKGSNYEVFM